MSSVIRSLVVKVGADTSGFSSATKNMSKNLKNMSRNIGSIGSSLTNNVTKPMIAATAAIGAAIGGLGMKGLQGAADLEGYRNTLNTVLKDSKKAGDTLKWAVNFANVTPFETSEVVEATVKLSAYGMVAKDVMTNVGDMASVMGKSLDQAVEAVADAQTGGLERLKEFGITKQMIVEEANKKLKGIEIVNAKGQITDQENFNKALFMLMEERFKGGMKTQATSWKGLKSTILGTISSALTQLAGMSADGTAIVGGVFDILKGKMKQYADKLTEMQASGDLERWAKKIGDAFGEFVDFMEKDAIPVIKEIADVIGGVAEWFAKLSPKTQENIGKFILLGAALGPVFSGISGILDMASKFTGFLSNVTKAAGVSKTVGAAGAMGNLGASLAALVGPAGWITLAVAALWGLYEINKKIKEDPIGASKNYSAGQQYSTYEQTMNNLTGKTEKKQTTTIGRGGSRPGDIPPMIPMYAKGTPYVPETGLALIHKGERIIPADQNKGTTVNHTGTIRIEGIGSAGQLLAAGNIIVDNMKFELAREQRRNK